MLGVFMEALQMRCDVKTWKRWLDYILKKKSSLCIQKLALYHSTGQCLATTRDFTVDHQIIMNIQSLFRRPSECCPESLSLHGVTYVIKSITSSQIIAFNGNRYLIVTHSKSIVICMIVKSRHKSEEASQYLSRIVQHLIKQNHWHLAYQDRWQKTLSKPTYQDRWQNIVYCTSCRGYWTTYFNAHLLLGGINIFQLILGAYILTRLNSHSVSFCRKKNERSLIWNLQTMPWTVPWYIYIYCMSDSNDL